MPNHPDTDLIMKKIRSIDMKDTIWDGYTEQQKKEMFMEMVRDILREHVFGKPQPVSFMDE